MLTSKEKYSLGLVAFLIMFFVVSGVSKAAYSITWAIGLITTLWIAYKHRKSDFFSYTPPKMMWMSICIFWALLISVSLLNGDIWSIKRALNLVLLGTVGWAMYIACQTEGGRKAALWACLIGSLIICASGIHSVFVLGEVRAAGYLGHPNSIGKTFDLVIPFLLYWLWIEPKRSIKFLLLISLCIVTYTLYLSGSRGAILGTAIMAAFVWSMRNFFLVPTYSRWMKLIGLLGIVGAVSYGVLSYVDMMARNYDVQRIYLSISSYHMWLDHFWIGVGLVNWQDVYLAQYMLPEATEYNLSGPHNIIMYYASTAGTIGLFGFLVFVLVSFWYGMRHMIRNYKDPWGYTWVWIVGVVFLHGLVDFGIADPAVYKQYFVTLGALLGYALDHT